MLQRINKLEFNINLNFILKTFILFSLLITNQAHSEVHPILLKNEPSMYANVYFGMSFDEFKSKLAGNIFGCTDSPNKAIFDKVCKISFRFNNMGINEGLAGFKGDSLVAFIGKVNVDQYSSITSELAITLKDQPQIEDREEKKGTFSSKINNQYSIWSYPNYLLLSSRFDVPRYEENGTNFSIFAESVNDTFIGQMKVESVKKSNIVLKTRVANVDLNKLINPNAPPEKVVANKPSSSYQPSNISASVVTNESSGGGYTPESSNVAVTTEPIAAKQPIEKPKKSWVFEENVDKLRGTSTKTAMVTSLENGTKDTLSLILRNRQQDGFEIFLVINGNIMPCNRGCMIKTNFDNRGITEYEARGGEGSTSVFIFQTSKLLNNLRNSNNLIVEVETYGATSQFEFDVKGLIWN